MLLDRLIHPRLRQRRFIAFIVAVTAITDHVDDDVLMELLAEVVGDLDRANARFRIVAVDVEDRRLHHLGDVGRIHR